ncbi:MAG: penicillin-binding protein activator LpoB [Burkholderiales bacterium]
MDPTVRGPVAGVGIEGHDIISMTDRMVRDILATTNLAAAEKPPRVIVDAEHFENAGSQPINKTAITDRLRVELTRASRGRMSFVGRHYARAVQTERDLKDHGVVDVGTVGRTKAQAGGDYRLGGRISTVDSRSAKSGMIQRYTQIVFEMFDLETGEIVWNNMYELSRAGADDVVYR